MEFVKGTKRPSQALNVNVEMVTLARSVIQVKYNHFYLFIAIIQMPSKYRNQSEYSKNCINSKNILLPTKRDNKFEQYDH